MADAYLSFPASVYSVILSHLLPPKQRKEEAAFVFARYEYGECSSKFRFLEWTPVPPSGFACQSAYHIELADEFRASAIKRAHDMQCSLVEFHSHLGTWPAKFSASDWIGFEEFVPHVWWRLKGRPYMAVVVARSSFDGLGWIDGPNQPQALAGIVLGDEIKIPTGLSMGATQGDFHDAI